MKKKSPFLRLSFLPRFPLFGNNPMSKRRNSQVWLLLPLLILCGQDIMAVTYTFNGGTSTSWNEASNWATGLPPNPLISTDDIFIRADCDFDLGVEYVLEGDLTMQVMARLTINNAEKMTISSTGRLINASSGGPGLQIFGTLEVNGQLQKNNTEFVVVESGGTMTVNGTFNNFGVGSTTINGTLNGSNGTIQQDSELILSGGSIQPGTSPGCLSLLNTSNSFTSGTITLEVDAITTACTDYDQLTVGDYTGGATVNITVAAGSYPNGTELTLIDGTGTGDASTFSVNILGAGAAQWSVKSGTGADLVIQTTVLPVELMYFNAATKGQENLLTWRTASEVNNQGFDIERSSDGRTWQTLAFVSGQGTTLEEQSYTYMDSRPLHGLNYYRLKQMDFDGQFEYSGIRSLMTEDSNAGVQVYPNPLRADGLLNVNLSAEPEDKAIFRIFDLNGKILHQETLSNQFNQSAYGYLPAGVYFIEVTSGYEAWRERLVVQ